MVNTKERVSFNERVIRRLYTTVQAKVLLAAKIESTDHEDGRTHRWCYLYDERNSFGKITDKVRRYIVESMCNSGLLVFEEGAKIDGCDNQNVFWFPKCQRCDEAVESPTVNGGGLYCEECTCSECGDVLDDPSVEQTCPYCMAELEKSRG